MIVTATVAVVAAIAVPHRARRQLAADEAVVVDLLRGIAIAQRKFVAQRRVDMNNNGRGEFASFGELLGTAFLRGTTQPLASPLLPASMRPVSMSVIAVAGYMLQMYLPDANAVGQPEDSIGGCSVMIPDPQQAERFWCCYAWPVTLGITGKHAFFVNQKGVVLACDNTFTAYSSNNGVFPPAAFRAGSSGTMECPLAIDTLGNDAELWHLVR